MTPDRIQLRAADEILAIVAQDDCHHVCDEPPADPCPCPPCRARAFRAPGSPGYDWRYRGNHHERADGGREAAVLRAWADTVGDEQLARIVGRPVGDLSARDWWVATSVVQWLGTGVGEVTLARAGFRRGPVPDAGGPGRPHHGPRRPDVPADVLDAFRADCDGGPASVVERPVPDAELTYWFHVPELVTSNGTSWVFVSDEWEVACVRLGDPLRVFRIQCGPASVQTWITHGGYATWPVERARDPLAVLRALFPDAGDDALRRAREALVGSSQPAERNGAPRHQETDAGRSCLRDLMAAIGRACGRLPESPQKVAIADALGAVAGLLEETT